MKFASRNDAGQQLAVRLLEQGVQVELVVGLPRGGVVVAAQVARILRCPLEVLAVRKIGHPLHREFAVGALAEAGVVLLDEKVLAGNPLMRLRLEAVIAEETARLRRYEADFHETRPRLEGKNVLLVDDGLATGATAEAAVLSARKQGVVSVRIAAPVCSEDAVARLTRVGSEVVSLLVDPDFNAVGCYYQDFPETTDEEVLALLRLGRGS